MQNSATQSHPGFAQRHGLWTMLSDVCQRRTFVLLVSDGSVVCVPAEAAKVHTLGVTACRALAGNTPNNLVAPKLEF